MFGPAQQLATAGVQNPGKRGLRQRFGITGRSRGIPRDNVLESSLGNQWACSSMVQSALGQEWAWAGEHSSRCRRRLLSCSISLLLLQFLEFRCFRPVPPCFSDFIHLRIEVFALKTDHIDAQGSDPTPRVAPFPFWEATRSRHGLMATADARNTIHATVI